jgi:hypothetical protein
MRLAACAISIALVAAGAWANWNDTSTGIHFTSLPAFPLTKVHSGMLRDGTRAQFDGLLAEAIDHAGDVLLRGTGKSGRTWSARFWLVALDQVYRGDLDGNGTQDYVVFGASGANGRLAPPRWMIVLLMDKSGLPVPFEAGLYDELGPRHVVDALHDGRAQLVVSDYDEGAWDKEAGAFCSGHWLTDLYEESGLGWREFHGGAAGLSFPFLHRWTYGPACDPQASPHAWKEEIGPEQHSTASTDVTSARMTGSHSNIDITLNPTAGCERFESRMVVYDDRSKREIALSSDSGYRANLLDRIRADKADVALRGVYRDAAGLSCRANLLWATK